MRLATLPAAIAIERAPIVDGTIGSRELLSLGPPRPHVDLGSARAIYVRLMDSKKPPAVCIEFGDGSHHGAVLFRFIFTNDALAQHWCAEFIEIARKSGGRR